jgi:DNA (cytosine-5)-methyltransferase 1
MKFIDFFSGIGGFRLGMEMAGHECVGHCEIDKFADKSYRAMHDVKEGEWYAADIRAVESGDLPEADCWCGGFPCQAFSIAGKRAGFEDMRGTLIFEIFRLAAERKPKILFLENVAGLLNHDGGRTFATILTGLWELGYDVQWQVLNSKDFGVPQNRERVFIVGRLRGTSTREIFPIIGSNGETLKQLIGGSQGNRVYDTGGASVTLSSQGGGQGAKTGLYLINKNHDRITFRDDFNCLGANYYKGLDAHQARTGVLEVRPVLTPDRLEKRQNGRRMKEPGEEMFTLTAQDKHGVLITDRINVVGNVYGTQSQAGKLYTTDGLSPTVQGQRVNSQGWMIMEATKKGYTEAHEGDSINLAVPGSETRRGRVGVANTLDTSCNQGTLAQGRIRRLTPRECFRLQGFPDTYFDRAAAVNSDSQLYKQAGNSVTVNVIYEIARRLT